MQPHEETVCLFVQGIVVDEPLRIPTRLSMVAALPEERRQALERFEISQAQLLASAQQASRRSNRQAGRLRRSRRPRAMPPGHRPRRRPALGPGRPRRPRHRASTEHPSATAACAPRHRGSDRRREALAAGHEGHAGDLCALAPRWSLARARRPDAGATGERPGAAGDRRGGFPPVRTPEATGDDRRSGGRVHQTAG